jgi:hypothetical protein
MGLSLMMHAHICNITKWGRLYVLSSMMPINFVLFVKAYFFSHTNYPLTLSAFELV